LTRILARRDALYLGVTLALLGYFLPWFPHPAAGLRLIGLEMGEWTKFLPQIRSGQWAAIPTLFYLPPISLGLILALATAGWPNRRWQSWLMRLLALAVSLLALPAWEVMRDEPASQWWARLALITLVVVAALRAALGANGLGRPRQAALALIALVGGLAPLLAYLTVRPMLAGLVGDSLGIGSGLWLHLAGHILILAAVLGRKKRRRPAPSFVHRDNSRGGLG
jgi:hypothetical protein